MNLFPVFVFLALVLEVAIVFYIVTMLASGLVSGIHGAPYVPIGRGNIPKLLLFAGVDSNDILYDLGSGDGRILRVAVKDFGVTKAIGYEVAPWPYWKSRWHLWRFGSASIGVRNQNFFSADISEATCVYIYLLPKLVDRLAGKLARELKPGARVMCPAFPINLAKHPEFQLKKSEKIGTLTAYLYQKL